MKVEQTKKAYNEILKVLKKHKDTCNLDIEDIERSSKCHLFGLELKEVHGFDIDPKIIRNTEWHNFSDYVSIGRFGEKYRRTISWSDDNSQPVDELLLKLSFCTGAYIFGGDYPTDFFHQFFMELKSLNPKYTDTANHSLYYSMENAGSVFNSFNDILKKYRELNREDVKQRQILKMKADLEKLQNS